MKFLLDRERVGRPILGLCILGIYFIGFDIYKVYGNNGWNWTNYVFLILLDTRLGFTYPTPDK